MSSLKNIDVPDATYYVQLRGKDHSSLLSSNQDYQQIKDLLQELCDQYQSNVIAYCFFEDSFHLIVKAGYSGIFTLIEAFTNGYTRYYFRDSERFGYLFEINPLLVLIEPQQYLLSAIYKVHRLPMTRGIVGSPSAYPWSSHREYLQDQCPSWLNRQDVLRRVSNHRSHQIHRYENFIEKSLQDDVNLTDGNHPRFLALASDAYINKIVQAQPNQAQISLDLHSLSDWICGEYQLEEKDLLHRRHHRQNLEIQSLICALALKLNVATIEETSDYFQCDGELLKNGIRSLNARRAMYLFKLETKLQSWLQSTVLPLPRAKNNQEDQPLRETFA